MTYPLGEPIRPEQAEPEERWIADDPAKPHIQRSSKTGMMRNVKPEPLPVPVWPFGNLPYLGTIYGMTDPATQAKIHAAKAFSDLKAEPGVVWCGEGDNLKPFNLILDGED